MKSGVSLSIAVCVLHLGACSEGEGTSINQISSSGAEAPMSAFDADLTPDTQGGNREEPAGRDVSPNDFQRGDSASDGDTETSVPDSNGANDGGPAETVDKDDEPNTDHEDSAQPTTPTPCSSVNQGSCACNNAAGFTTWTWWIDGEQRCATTYAPPGESEPLPVLISNNCYSTNGLGECQVGSEMVAAADRFGFLGVCTTSADGNWTFGNDGVINDSNPTPCDPEDSKDITYINGVFDIIDLLGAAGEADTQKVYSWGFSQNAMFTAWISTCYADRIKGFWQGGSGLFVAGVTDPLPQMEGVCRASDYAQYGQDCAVLAPCDACQYFPVYPVATTPPMAGCIMAYQDDYLFETATPMADAMIAEGHKPTLLQFPAIGRGHSNPLIHWDWLVGCMGVVEHCTTACSDAVVSCVEDTGESSAQARQGHYESCLNAALGDCMTGCAPTLDMLRVVERPCVVDGVCEKGETSQSCAADCGGTPSGEGDPSGVNQLPSCEERGRQYACCGDLVCDGPENADNCVIDCANTRSGNTTQLPSCEERGRQFACCGDLVCDGPENSTNCVIDCT